MGRQFVPAPGFRAISSISHREKTRIGPDPTQTEISARPGPLGWDPSRHATSRAVTAYTTCHFSTGPSICSNLMLLVMLCCLPGSRSVKPRGAISSSQYSPSLFISRYTTCHFSDTLPSFLILPRSPPPRLLPHPTHRRETTPLGRRTAAGRKRNENERVGMYVCMYACM